MSEERGTMASAAVLKGAKKQLRTLMKQKLSSIPAESVETQSRLGNPKYCGSLLMQQ